jgi:hypothetical protein
MTRWQQLTSFANATGLKLLYGLDDLVGRKPKVRLFGRTASLFESFRPRTTVLVLVLCHGDK